MKRLFALLLAFSLILGSFPMQSFAEETEPAATTEATEAAAETTAATEPAAETTAVAEVPAEEPVTEPTPVTVTGIAVAELPIKTVYQVGESLDLTGGSVSVSYSDGTAQTVGMTADMVSGFRDDSVSAQTLTVAYEGFEAYFDVTVAAPAPINETEPTKTAGEKSAKEISWIELTSTPTKIQYVVNQDELDVTSKVLFLREDESFNLTAISHPHNAAGVYNWTSSDEDSVYVDEHGTVTALQPGKVITITCTAQDGSKKKAIVKIKVTNPPAN